MTVPTALEHFWLDEQAQDLIEYALLMAFVALASTSLFIGSGGSVSGIWTAVSARLTAASSASQ